MTESTSGNSYRWGVLNSTRHTLPLPSQTTLVEVQDQGNALQLMLFAEPTSQVGSTKTSSNRSRCIKQGMAFTHTIVLKQSVFGWLCRKNFRSSNCIFIVHEANVEGIREGMLILDLQHNSAVQCCWFRSSVSTLSSSCFSRWDCSVKGRMKSVASWTPICLIIMQLLKHWKILTDSQIHPWIQALSNFQSSTIAWQYWSLCRSRQVCIFTWSPLAPSTTAQNGPCKFPCFKDQVSPSSLLKSSWQIGTSQDKPQSKLSSGSVGLPQIGNHGRLI